ncbi:carboxymuconolactone decarboxylase family protein [Marinicella sp. S1101]|uniref:carboxymuconolactone decarboxylase family protein n=1 Tax=Marinicella marina TaxID=2996016 RepID=UPI0022609DE6|nr:carboxymuconolactone decarboxylase family protein [Marinicella marina]MCX7552750.1 carboxymuconolactone decarboxylase family protein [Marinicella marina]MDJ1139941.1 carboxymuconolactone decarboxylase family protein [Marinicella marina]
MSIKELKSALPEFAKDIKLNLGSVLTEEGSAGLTEAQIAMIALGSAYATKDREVIQGITGAVETLLSAEDITAVKAATTIMAMNNVYYRFTHLVSDQGYASMPAKLRMNVMANPGIDKVDFELISLAVSAIEGCGLCIDSHVAVIAKHGISKEGIQSSIRIAATINAVSQALDIER